MARPLYIFDLDGTLALIEHRRHLVEQGECRTCKGLRNVFRDAREGEVLSEWIDSSGKKTFLPPHDPCTACSATGKAKPDWPAFFAACVDDLPNWPVINTMRELVRAKCEVRIWSGRSAEVMNETLTWLHRFVFTEDSRIDPDKVELCMRRTGDFTPDEQLKAVWYDSLSDGEKARLVAIFDDRDKVVRMWRSKGVACFQVAPGEF